MPRPLTVRLADDTRRRLVSVARRRGRTPSALVRSAIEAWLDAEARGAEGSSFYDAVADLVGTVHGGDPGRSTRSRREIAGLLRRRQARRR